MPLNLTEPDVGSISCSTQRPTVDLPEPLSPTRPSVSPSSIDERHVGDRLHEPLDRPDALARADREHLDQVGDLEQLATSSDADRR